jgi:hypothetical protein
MKEKSAFWSGFRAGFANSLAIVVENSKKAESKPFEVKKTKIGGIASDWAKLGGDMRRAMNYVAANAK